LNVLISSRLWKRREDALSVFSSAGQGIEFGLESAETYIRSFIISNQASRVIP